MHYSPILAPVVALIAWTVIMQIWMMITRGIAFKKAGIDVKDMTPGTRGPDLVPQLDPRLQWKADNYNNLLEQPTIFYAVCLSLALMGFGVGINLWLAWGYVGFRVLHSLYQSTVNVVANRVALFTLYSLCLLGLTVHAAARIIHDCLG